MSADKILSGTIGVSRYIQSTNYVADTSGWKINGDGTAYPQNAIVRGTVYANAGWFRARTDSRICHSHQQALFNSRAAPACRGTRSAQPPGRFRPAQARTSEVEPGVGRRGPWNRLIPDILRRS